MQSDSLGGLLWGSLVVPSGLRRGVTQCLAMNFALLFHTWSQLGLLPCLRKTVSALILAPTGFCWFICTFSGCIRPSCTGVLGFTGHPLAAAAMASAEAHLEAEALPHISDGDTNEIRAAVEKGDLRAAATKAQEILASEEQIQLHIAVTGESGSGKSSFVNAMRGLQDREEGAAELGVMETTMECSPYPHPQHSHVTVWDLPGIGAPSCTPDTYLKQVHFDRYDFFIIISSSRFTQNAATLAKEIQAQGKRFYFVRSKVDQDVSNERRLYDEEGVLKAKGKQATETRSQRYDEMAVLLRIRQDCERKLARLGIRSPQVFLVCRDDFSMKYDGPRLLKTFLDDLPSEKKLSFLQCLAITSREVLRKKKEELMKYVWLKSLASCGASAVPIPGLSAAVDIAILVTSLKEYCRTFGLSEESLQKLAEQVNKPVKELTDGIKTPLDHEITKDLVIKLLTQSIGGAAKNLPFLLKSIPTFLGPIGSLVSAAMAFPTTFFLLRNFLSDAADDAERVLQKALEGTTQKSHLWS
ncbi:interferon-inducible GTPase 5-like isoform X1 [Apteryx mantelli]|uniref:Interferon-inducible GTPase 5-like isoform X1 n=1 Tax=Apteryx mantelli TaxID=2696672 RepID=A0ABM4EKB1_9AVES